MKVATRLTRYHTQWAAQFFVAAELSRRGYLVSFPLGNAPASDLHVSSPSGRGFTVEVKGMRAVGYWLVRKPPRNGGRRYYILTYIPARGPFTPPRYFILTSKQVTAIHADDPRWPGFTWGKALPFENHWSRLPR